ncbi:unnamed protein product [Caenorhabditis angaria]|uniref:Uncharacterized protein n=1 Tax=Caenorhabditis angaria TaxID=860376 RepID=A0A9P1IT27_9PELO|nr:unnamed protein product [Caenorhabditis angaria]
MNFGGVFLKPKTYQKGIEDEPEEFRPPPLKKPKVEIPEDPQEFSQIYKIPEKPIEKVVKIEEEEEDLEETLVKIEVEDLEYEPIQREKLEIFGKKKVGRPKKSVRVGEEKVVKIEEEEEDLEETVVKIEVEDLEYEPIQREKLEILGKRKVGRPKKSARVEEEKVVKIEEEDLVEKVVKIEVEDLEYEPIQREKEIAGKRKVGRPKKSVKVGEEKSTKG